jgi:hypothetical protein
MASLAMRMMRFSGPVISLVTPYFMTMLSAAVVKALVVVVLAELQWTGLRRTRDVVGGARVAMS